MTSVFESVWLYNIKISSLGDIRKMQKYTLKKRLGYNSPNLINVTHRCGEIVSTKRIGD